MPDVFISHSHQDLEVARRLSLALSDAGFDTWLDARDISAGQEWATAILRAITSSRVFVLIFSESANRSISVLRETELAVKNGLTIIPYRIRGAQPEGALEYFIGTRQWIDEDGKGAFTTLVRAVERALGKSARVGASLPASSDIAPPSLFERLKGLFVGSPNRNAAMKSGVQKALTAEAHASRLREALTCHRFEEIGRVTFPASASDAAETLIADLPARLESIARQARQVSTLQYAGRQIEAVESALSMLSNLKSELVYKSGPMAEAVAEIVGGWSDLFSARREAMRADVDVEREIENPFIFGNPVQALDSNLFTGRTDVVLEIERNLVRAAQVPTLLLYGQRRMGKTSILNQLPNLLGPSFLPVLVDCQAPATVESQAALLRHVSRCMAAALNLRLGIDRSDEESRRARGALELPLSALQSDAYSAFEDWLDLFHSRLPDKNVRVLMCLDEFERLGEIIKSGWGARFLDALRHWTQHRPRFALMFVGSHTFEQLGPAWTDRFISARRLKVTFLRDEDVRQLLTKPTPTFNLTYAPGALEAIRDATNGQPFLTQVLASELVHHMNRQRKKRASSADVTTAITDALERSAEYFADIWFSRTEAERGVLRAIARGVRQPPAEPVARALFDYDLLNGEGDFAVPLVGRWVREHHLND